MFGFHCVCIESSNLVYVTCNYVETLTLRHPTESFSMTSVQSDCCRRSLSMNSSAPDIMLISNIFDFSRLSANFISKLKTYIYVKKD